MGNVGVAIKRQNFAGARKRVTCDITMSASYATNGDTILDADIQAILGQKAADLSVVDLFIAELGSAGHELFLDRTNKKIKAFNGITEIANAVNLSAVVVRCIFEYGDSPAKGV